VILRMPRPSRALLRALLPWLLGGGLLLLALAALHREFARIPIPRILAELRVTPPRRLGASLALTGLGYLAMTGYDYLGCLAAGCRLPWRRAAFVSFIAYAASLNLGMTLLSGGGVRLRLYAAYGLTVSEIARVVAYTGLLFVLGLLAVGGVSFLVAPILLPPGGPLPPGSLRGLGLCFLLLLGALFLARARGGETVRLGRLGTLRLASPRLLLLMTLFSCLDWVFAAGALYALLPGSGLSFVPFLGMFVAGQLVGLVSQVPGGLGVFETSLLLLMRPYCPAPAVLSALVAYRGIYFLLPLFLAGCGFALQELRPRAAGDGAPLPEPSSPPAGGGGEAVSSPNPVEETAVSLFPRLAAALVFACGTLLLLAGFVPDGPDRLRAVARFLPLGVIEASHLTSALAGMGLILLARGLADRLRAAWAIGTALLVLGALLTVARGGHGVAVIALLCVAGLLLAQRRDFPLRSSLFAEAFSPGWTLAAATALAACLWIGFLAYRAAPYVPGIWVRFELLEGAPRFLRAGLAAATLLLFSAGWRLLRVSSPPPPPPSEEERERVAAVVRSDPNPDGNLAFLPEKRFLWDPSGRAFWMFALQGRTWVFLGNPIGPREAWPGVADRAMAIVSSRGGRPLLYEIGEGALSLALERGLVPYKIGEEGVVDLRTFSLEGPERKSLRRVLARKEREALRFEVVPPEAVPPLLPRLGEISEAWLAGRGGREKGFSLGFFDPDYLRRFPCALVRAGERVVAFANLMDGAGEEIAPDLMRHEPEAPRETMEFLFLRAILWAQERGYALFRLGSVPLSGIDPGPFAPLPLRAMRLLYEHGERLYPFRGLRAFKEKFGPRWRPRFVAVPGPLHLAPALADAARLVAASGSRSPVLPA